MTRRTVKSLLLEYTPTFCWVTAMDLVVMLEYIDENIEANTVHVLIHRLVKEGKLQRRPYPRGQLNYMKAGKPPSLYLRTS